MALKLVYMMLHSEKSDLANWIRAIFTKEMQLEALQQARAVAKPTLGVPNETLEQVLDANLQALQEEPNSAAAASTANVSTSFLSSILKKFSSTERKFSSTEIKEVQDELEAEMAADL